jgi:hypothetical protein
MRWPVVDSVTLPNWTDENVDDIVLGSGAECWDWYVDGIGQVVGGERDGTFLVAFTDGFGNIEDYTFTRDDFRATARKVAAGQTGVRRDIVQDIRNDDLGADAVDVIIQLTVLDDLRFG